MTFETARIHFSIEVQFYCCCRRGCLSSLIRTLRSEDGDGRENVAEKVNSRSFNLHRDYSKSLTLSNLSEPF